MRGVLQQNCLLFEVKGFGNTPTTLKGWWCYLDSSSSSGVYSPHPVFHCKCQYNEKGHLYPNIAMKLTLVFQTTWKDLRESSSWLIIESFCMSPMPSELRHMAVSLRNLRRWESMEWSGPGSWQRGLGCVKIKKMRKFAIRWSHTSWWLMPSSLLKSTASFILFAGEKWHRISGKLSYSRMKLARS